MPNVLSPRDLVSIPDNMDETVISSSCTKCRFSHDEAKINKLALDRDAAIILV